MDEKTWEDAWNAYHNDYDHLKTFRLKMCVRQESKLQIGKCTDSKCVNAHSGSQQREDTDPMDQATF